MSVLALPPTLRGGFVADRPGAEARSLARGDAKKVVGRLRLTKQIRLMHDEGYIEVNARQQRVRSLKRRIRKLLPS
jgi:hypothetical protein